MITSPVMSADSFPPEVMHLLGTARQVIDEHVGKGGHCVCCGSDWPCQRARDAELALAGL